MSYLYKSLMKGTPHENVPALLSPQSALTGAAAPADRDQRCEQLLPAMQTALQALRRGQSLTPDQQTTWRTWNADCKAAKWQQQLAETAPPPPPLEKNFPKMLPPPERPEAPEAPSTEVLPSGFVGVEVQFDRFKNRTTVSFPSTRHLMTRANTQLTPVWFATFNGQTPSTMPSMVLLTFWKTNKTWQYLRCHSLAMLADGSPV